MDQRTVTDLQLPKTSRQAVKCHGICPTPSFVFYHMCTTTSSKTSWNLHDSRVQSVWNCAALLTSLCITLAMLWSTVMIALQSIDTIPNPSHFSQVYVNTMPRRFRQSEPYLTQSYHPTGVSDSAQGVDAVVRCYCALSSSSSSSHSQCAVSESHAAAAAATD